MKFNKLRTKIFTMLILFSSHSNAFIVDKMVIISDEKGNGIITLTNDEKVPLFINAKIEEINIENYEVINKKEYGRENLSDWKISLTHQKLILRPGESKDIGIRSLCHNTSCDNSRDLMFSLPFLPSPYRPDGVEGSGMDINFGFSPVYIIPTDNPVYDYDINRTENEIIIRNKSNTIINVLVNGCITGESKASCKQKYIVVAGREKSFSLPEAIVNNDLDITVMSHDRKYKKKLLLKGNL